LRHLSPKLKPKLTLIEVSDSDSESDEGSPDSTTTVPSGHESLMNDDDRNHEGHHSSIHVEAGSRRELIAVFTEQSLHYLRMFLLGETILTAICGIVTTILRVVKNNLDLGIIFVICRDFSFLSVFFISGYFIYQVLVSAFLFPL
jgi:hypothetical protein